jgi:uncharacterized Ntn-hydrolase superfamily protein
MTWSLLAVDGSGALGVAIASRFFAVGALCPGVLAGHGALSSQALMNPLYRAAGLEALGRGAEPAEIVRLLTGLDGGRDVRQLHVLAASGHSAAHTGAACIEWCGHLAGAGFSVAGNMLAGARVIEDTARAYEAGSALPFAERLLAAMEAGERAGGDKRGRQGAALVIHTTEEYPSLDLRVDDHAEPLAELRRLYRVSLERFQPFVQCLPTRSNPKGITDRTAIEAHIAKFQAQRNNR